MFDVIVAPISDSKDKVVVKKDDEDATKSSENANEKNDNKEEIVLQSSTTRTAAPTTQLAFLPTKFRKLVWIKRNDYVIVQCGDEEVADNKEEDTIQDQSNNKKSGNTKGGGFRYVITHILYKEQVKHIKSKGLWPSDPLFAEEGTTPDDVDGQEEADTVEDKDKVDEVSRNDTYYEDDDGIVFDDDDLMVNTNRIATLRVEDSSSDEDSD